MGTKFTLTQDFYKAKMERDYGIKILVPDEEDIEFIHYVIYEELDFSIFSPESSARFVQIIEKWAAAELRASFWDAPRSRSS